MDRINVDTTCYTDAVIVITQIDNAYQLGERNLPEHRTHVGYIPFSLHNYDNAKEFREAVFQVADTLQQAYENHDDNIMCVEVKFNFDYING